MVIDKEKLKDSMGRLITQSLFLEIKYDVDLAVYSLAEEDKEFKGKTYPSLKRLYLECEDPTEYTFAKKYLLGWDHWKRLNENKVLLPYFDKWRDELEISLRSSAIQDIIEHSTGDKGFQAAKWLAEKGWDKRSPGRPTKAEKEHRNAIEDRIAKEFEDDFERLTENGALARGSVQ